MHEFAYFMFPLRDRLPNSLHDALEFLHRSHDATLDQLEFRTDGCTQLLQSSVICVDVLDRVCRLREFPEEVILRSDGMEQDREMLREAASGCKKRWRKDRVRGMLIRDREENGDDTCCSRRW
jgi:hypothetical protein